MARIDVQPGPELLEAIKKGEGREANGDSSHTSLRSQQAPWPAPLAEAAHHGPAGEVVRTIEPHSEADPAALLLQFLATFGNACGRSAGFEAEATFHGTNLYVVIVGATSKGRKGSSFAQVRRPVELADPSWSQRVVSGISSGEGVIHAVRDPVETRRKARKGEAEEADEEGYVTEVADEGEPDKRALAYEPEFAQVLRVMRRDGSTTDTTIRRAWEGHEQLGTLTRNSPLKATGAHISIIGHVSAEELRREMQTTDAASGFGNRILYVCAKRSKRLPEGGSLGDDDWSELVPVIREALRYGSVAGVLRRDQAARELWAGVYGPLSEGRPGLLGALTSRAEAQAMRLATIYAVLDCAPEVRVEHLRAGLAVWDYCAASARYVWGDALGDETADTILARLREAGAEGLTRTAIRDLFGRHKPQAEVERALTLLASLGVAERAARPTGGRPSEVWILSEGSSDRSDESDRTPLRSHISLPSQGGVE